MMLQLMEQPIAPAFVELLLWNTTVEFSFVVKLEVIEIKAPPTSLA